MLVVQIVSNNLINLLESKLTILIIHRRNCLTELTLRLIRRHTYIDLVSLFNILCRLTYRI